jgi:hypothetical protein
MVMKPEKQRTAKCHPYLARQMSKWFYDTSTGTAPREQPAVVLLLEWAQIAQGVGYEEMRWTRGFTWFRLSERNTLRPWVNGVVLLCLSVQLKSPSPALGVCPDLL